jgi:hypothetical protein
VLLQVAADGVHYAVFWEQVFELQVDQLVLIVYSV